MVIEFLIVENRQWCAYRDRQSLGRRATLLPVTERGVKKTAILFCVIVNGTWALIAYALPNQLTRQRNALVIDFKRFSVRGSPTRVLQTP